MLARPSLNRLSVILVVMVMASGLRPSLAQTTDGDWTIPTNFGQFVMTLANGGSEIQTIKTTFSAFSCGGRTQSGTITSSQNPTWPVTDRQFDIQLSFFPGDVKLNITGSFAESGVEASGTWSVDVLGTICPGTWGPVINVSIEETDDEMPQAFALGQNYPNPFNPTTRIGFEVAQPGHVTLTITDLTGREVARVVDGQRAAGSHEVSWNASGIPTGFYLYTLSAGTYSETKGMVLLK